MRPKHKAETRGDEKNKVSVIRPLFWLFPHSVHDPLPPAGQPPLGCDSLVLALPTDAKNLNKINTHRPRNTMFFYCCYVSVCQYEVGIINIGFEHLILRINLATLTFDL